MAAKDKTFKTYSQQLDALVNDKGLTVSDRDAAIDTLKHISYFALVSGYKEPFRDKNTGKYKDGVSFEDIVALYKFDTTLSSLVLHNLLSCERHLKAAFGYHFARMYGEGQNAYLNRHNYDWDDKEKQGRIEKMLVLLRQSVEDANTEFAYIDHYQTRYKDVPVWILLHSVTFGELARMYEYAKPELRDVICTEFPALKSRNLSHVLSFLSTVRNTCAHNDPLYNAKFRYHLPVLGLHRSLGLVREDGKSCTSGQHDAFATLIAMRYMLPQEDVAKCVERISGELDTAASDDRWIERGPLLHLMGFPENWAEVATAAV